MKHSSKWLQKSINICENFMYEGHFVNIPAFVASRSNILQQYDKVNTQICFSFLFPDNNY